MYYRRQPMTIKYLKELIASEKFKDYPASTQESYKALLKRKEERHAKKMEARKAYKEEHKELLAKAMEQVKVGDVFSASWGYEQTNVDFFQVVALVGKHSVRVRHVCPTLLSEKQGAMCADRVYAIPQNGEMLPPLSYSSVFIKDNEKGDVKRIETYSKDGTPCFKLSSFAWATKEKAPTASHYESWYA